MRKNKTKSKRKGQRRPRKSLSSFNQNQTYTFRISSVAVQSSNGSGVIAGYIYNDPTGSFGAYAEHTNYLANLFTEMRVVRSRFTLTSLLPFTINEAKETTNGSLAVGIFNRTSSGLPTLSSWDQVLDNQPSFMWPVCSDTTGRGRILTSTWTHVNFQLVTTSSPDYAGCPGGLMFYGSGMPVSSSIFMVQSEIFIQYRGRA